MSINYDRLGQHLEDFDQAETFHAKWVAVEAIRVNAVATARELLALRKETERLFSHYAKRAHLHAAHGEKAEAESDAAVADNLAFILNGGFK